MDLRREKSHSLAVSAQATEMPWYELSEEQAIRIGNQPLSWVGAMVQNDGDFPERDLVWRIALIGAEGLRPVVEMVLSQPMTIVDSVVVSHRDDAPSVPIQGEPASVVSVMDVTFDRLNPQDLLILVSGYTGTLREVYLQVQSAEWSEEGEFVISSVATPTGQ